MSEQGNIVQNVEPQVVADKEPDLRDDIAYALHDIKSRETETPEQTEARRRDEQGRFVKANEKPEAQAKRRETLALPTAPKEGGETSGAESQPIPAAPAVKAPDTWSAEAKAIFGNLDPVAQKEILKRENDVAKTLMAHDEYRTLGRRIAEESAPYMHIIRAEGGDEGLAYKNFLNYAYIVRQGTPEQKQQALLQLARQFNIPLGQASQQAPTDPVYSTLQEQQAKIQRLEGVLGQLFQSQEQREQSQLGQEIADFANAPGHEHFEKVRQLMGIYLENGQAQDLNEAYDKAIWATPEIRTTLTAAQTQQAQAQRLSQSQAATEAARRAAGSVSGGPGGAKAPNGSSSERSLEDELRANLRAASGRV